MNSRLLDWLDSQPTPRRRLYSALIALLLLTLPCYLAGFGLLALTGTGDGLEPGPPPEATSEFERPTDTPVAPDDPSPTAQPVRPPTERPTVIPTPTIVERSEPTQDFAPLILTAPPLIPAEPTPTSTDSVLPIPSATDDVSWVTVVPPEPTELPPEPTPGP